MQNLITIWTLVSLLLLSCNQEQKQLLTRDSKIAESQDEQMLEKEVPRKTDGLIAFLENPIDLKAFKFNRELVTTSVGGDEEYYLNPNKNDSIFYEYIYPNTEFRSNFFNRIIVFKYGKNKHVYDDPTEILIELNIRNQNNDLQQANLIGLNKQKLEFRFGNDYKIQDDRIVYYHKNKILLIQMDNSKVKSYRYVVLNTELIDSKLIQEIIVSLN